MNKGVKIFLCVVLAGLAVFLFSYVTMSLWNWLVPALFGGPVITFWQAAGLLLLSKLLFWGVGGGKHHHYQKHMAWKKGLHEKFSNMTPEQREAFKQRMKQKWCTWEESKPETGTDTDTNRSS